MSIRIWTPVAWIIRRGVDPERRHAWSLPDARQAPIVVWPRHAVPPELWESIEDPDDVDWVALVPKGYDPDGIPWLSPPAFGVRRVRTYALEDAVLCVGHHA